MASNPTIRKGICINVGNCPNANEKKIIEVGIGEDFVCPNPECRGMLVEASDKGTDWKKIIIAIVAVLVIGGGVGGYFLMSSGDKTIPVSSLSIDNAALTLNEKEAGTLTAIVLPVDATNKSVEWTSSNPNVATVENGAIQANEAGNATITVKTLDGSNLLATSEITVNKPAGTGVNPLPKTGGGTTTTPQPRGGNDGIKEIKVTGGTYKGETRQGKPHGNGTITYSSRTLIHDLKQRYAEPGDYVTGLFREGKIQNVKWYNRNGDFKETIIP